MSLPLDIYFETLLKLPIKDILNICILDKKLYKLCRQDYLWLRLLQRDFQNDFSDFLQDPFIKTNKKLYQLLHSLKILKEKLKIGTSLYKLYSAKTLELAQNKLTSLPKEIGALARLESLNLTGNQLTTLPPEIGKLLNLGQLFLGENRLTEVPKEIGNLKKLQILVLHNNRLTTLPKEIYKIINLKFLNLVNNLFTPSQIKEIESQSPKYSVIY